MPTIANVHVGKAQTKTWKPSHVPGVHEGNRPGRTWRERGVEKKEQLAATAGGRRSTGINPRSHEPIDPRSPRLTPA